MEKKRLKLNIGADGKLCVEDVEQMAIEESAEKRKIPLGGNIIGTSDNKFRFVPINRFEECDEFIQNMYATTSAMGLTHANTDKIYELCGQLIETYTKNTLKLLQNEQCNPIEIINDSSEHMIRELKKLSTQSKRLIELKKNPLYVEPIEVALRLKWHTRSCVDSDLPSHRLVPSTCQFVSIRKTLSAIFSQPNFQSMYTNYNLRERHECKDGVYKNFCCGSTYKSRDIFRDPLVIQLQLFMDECEVTSPVKSKATIHKICGIYLQIRNLPENLSSKIDNIFLVALVNGSDLKKDYVLNDVNQLIVEELLILESIGFETSDGKTWKAGLINIALDNLGANQLLGFSKGFRANYYCRICELSREECEISTSEVKEKLRTMQSIEENIDILNENPNASLTDTKGVRMKCLYNNLKSYNMYENVSLDVMHDIHEGVIPSFLSVFFDYCISKRISTEQDLIRKIRDYDYGVLFEEKKPSILGLKKSHLGQNASQALCLILHLPFIFYDIKHKLNKIWPTLATLLQCIQIVMSVEITESNLKRLEKCIEIYLKGILTFKDKLIPKEHLYYHYIEAIRKMGPLKHGWTMRFECKHKFFTDAARTTYNFININKTLAMKHQEYICAKKFAIYNDVKESKKMKLLSDHSEFSKYESFLSSIDKNIDFHSLHHLPFLEFNSYMYRAGLFLIEHFLVYKIMFVLKSQTEYYFLCELYETKSFDFSLNAIEIEAYSPEKQLAYLKHSELCNLKSFAKKSCDGKFYIIAENCTVYDL